jgi:hypothetical protein
MPRVRLLSVCLAARWLAVLLFALPWLIACDTGRSKKPKESVPGLDSECKKLFEQCTLPDGPIGVCNDVPCQHGEPGPCLRCFSQH